VQLVEITETDVKILVAGITADKLLNAIKKNKPIASSIFRFSKENRETFVTYFDEKIDFIRNKGHI
jgi:hypothetical protein